MTARRSITVPGFAHGSQPIPAACRRGPLLMTGGVHGTDRVQGGIPHDLGDQVRNMFDNLAAILTAAGGSLDDVVKVTIYAATPEARAIVNDHWCRAFPDPDSRPARHTQMSQTLLPPMLVQCDATAFIADP